jgi:hypothetical protein
MVLALLLVQVVPAAPAIALAEAPIQNKAARALRAEQLRLRKARELRAQRAARAKALRERRSIDRFCEELADFAQDMDRRRLFALWRDVPTTLGKWAEFDDPKKLEAALKRQEVLQVAEVWVRDDGAAAIAVTLGGESRDWTYFTDYCFRADGHLARMESPRDTDLALEERVGQPRKQYFRTTGDPVRATPDKRGRANPDGHPIYMTLSDVPFASMLWRAPQASR